MLKDYFPDEYGDRKILAYPIGQFISTINNMWDDELQTITLDADSLIDCFSSGWLSVNGVAGKQYLQDLKLPLSLVLIIFLAFVSDNLVVLSQMD